MIGEWTTAEGESLLSSDAPLERISYNHLFTEGPVWHALEGTLYWTDIMGDTIWKWTPGVGRSVVLRPTGKANGMALDREGRLVVAGYSSRNVWRREQDGTITVLATHYEGKKLNTPNDIVVKSDSGIYFTNSTGGLSNTGMEGPDLQRYLVYSGVYRIEPADGSLTLVVEDMEGCNGLCFSPDESLLYVNDTAARHIKVFDVQPDGTVRNERVFVDVRGEEPGNPDGMKVDASGNVYCTGPGGIHVYSPAGEHLGRLRIPSHCSNLTWGDEDWKSLYITARKEVYRLRMNVAGVPR